jgi:hypothetical protein
LSLGSLGQSWPVSLFEPRLSVHLWREGGGEMGQLQAVIGQFQGAIVQFQAVIG